MRIGIDAMGGDFAPTEVLKGAVAFLDELSNDIEIVLFGQQAVIEKEIANLNINNKNLIVVDASEVIEMAEHPTRALSQKKDSSIVKGYAYLKQNEIDAFVGAGNTGAMLVGAIYSIQNIPGVIRPTISTLLPKTNGAQGLLVDVGANSDCKPDILYQFGILGSLYAQHVLKIEKPKVGLINIGEEEGKGNLLTQATYSLMKENDAFNFVGNVEGRDIFNDNADVLICDGFTGNVILKTIEGFYTAMKKDGAKNPFLDRFDHEDYGGTPIIGVNAPVIIGHGISKSKSFKNMLSLAKNIVDSKLIEKINKTFKEYE